VAAFINDRRAHKFAQPTGGLGFFECINDRAVAFALFDAAQGWLRHHGMEAMDGPINFGENDRYWGLLVDGFMRQGFGMPYNPPYYRSFFEEYGFEVYFEQVTKHLDLRPAQPFPERFMRIHEWSKHRSQIEVRPFDLGRREAYGRYFMEIYNDAWQYHENFSPLTPEQITKLIADLSPVLIEELAIFAFVKGEPAGFAIALPDLNQVFAPLGGKLTFWQALLFLWRKRNKFAWYRRRGILTRARVVIMGVKPKFQKLGVESALIAEPVQWIRHLGFTELELGWVGDFNPKMRALLDATEAEYAKTHYTYRYVFDPVQRQAVRQRSEVIPMGTKSSTA
jgi:GNAT superfamily N-acetyltransferase